jgi:hypothetical protein
MVMVKGDPAAQEMPSTEMLAAMNRFNEQLVEAGLMLDGDGFKPSAFGKRIQFGDGGTTTVVDGPFSQTKELIAGYWVLKVRDMDEALEWMQRAPFSPGDELEIRPYAEDEDFGDALTPELKEQEARLRDMASSNASR